MAGTVGQMGHALVFCRPGSGGLEVQFDQGDGSGTPGQGGSREGTLNHGQCGLWGLSVASLLCCSGWL